MKQNFLEVGKIVGTHGVRGMVRIQAWCDTPEFFCTLKKLYLDKNGAAYLEALRSSPHGNVVIAALKGVDSIEDADLEEGQYFITELIGCEVFDADSGRLLGTVSDVSETGANDVWHIKRGEKEYLIPCIDEVVISVDIDAERVVIRPLKGIFEDED